MEELNKLYNTIKEYRDDKYYDESFDRTDGRWVAYDICMDEIQYLIEKLQKDNN